MSADVFNHKMSLQISNVLPPKDDFSVQIEVIIMKNVDDVQFKHEVNVEYNPSRSYEMIESDMSWNLMENQIGRIAYIWRICVKLTYDGYVYHYCFHDDIYCKGNQLVCEFSVGETHPICRIQSDRTHYLREYCSVNYNRSCCCLYWIKNYIGDSGCCFCTY